jgi:hypothetical protein
MSGFANIQNYGRNVSGSASVRPRRVRAFSGKFGAASKPRKLNAEERRAVEHRLRAEGKI